MLQWLTNFLQTMVSEEDPELSLEGFLCIFVQEQLQPTQSQLFQIYSVDWTDVYDTYTIEHRTEPVSH